MFARIVITTLFTVLVGLSSAQVRIILPARSLRARAAIEARVLNNSNVPVTYCVQFGQYSPKGDSIESTPIPFYVQRRNGNHWNTLLIGPDIVMFCVQLFWTQGSLMSSPSASWIRAVSSLYWNTGSVIVKT